MRAETSFSIISSAHLCPVFLAGDIDGRQLARYSFLEDVAINNGTMIVGHRCWACLEGPALGVGGRSGLMRRVSKKGPKSGGCRQTNYQNQPHKARNLDENRCRRRHLTSAFGSVASDVVTSVSRVVRIVPALV